MSDKTVFTPRKGFSPTEAERRELARALLPFGYTVSLAKRKEPGKTTYVQGVEVWSGEVEK
jgi:hypothetical protein